MFAAVLSVPGPLIDTVMDFGKNIHDVVKIIRCCVNHFELFIYLWMVTVQAAIWTTWKTVLLITPDLLACHYVLTISLN